jgi:hypothetical protein
VVVTLGALLQDSSRLLGSSPFIVVEHRDICIALCDLVETSKLLLWWWVGEEDQVGLGGFLNNVDVGKPLWRAEPRDKSLCHLCCARYLLLLVFDLNFRVFTRSTCSMGSSYNHCF